LGLGDGFDQNTELLDVNNDGIFEIMQGGGVFGTVRLLDSNGNTLWAFQPSKSNPPWRMVFGDLNNDSLYEFYVADGDGLYQLNGTGKIIWKVNNQASHGSSVQDVEIFTDRKTDRHYLITINDVFTTMVYFKYMTMRGKRLGNSHTISDNGI